MGGGVPGPGLDGGRGVPGQVQPGGGVPGPGLDGGEGGVPGPHLDGGEGTPKFFFFFFYTACTCYTAGGMPLAFTQEDFLVIFIPMPCDQVI